MYRTLRLLILCLLALSCSDEEELIRIAADPVDPPGPTPVLDTFLRAADLSSLPELEANNTALFNEQAQPEPLLETMAANGVNAVRLRLWYQPAGPHSGFAEVRALAERVQSMGMQVWLTVHYSDWWA
ncbi:MAG: glycosyl hydrolase 53 family protein, partial [Bacteroidota bacterium]